MTVCHTILAINTAEWAINMTSVFREHKREGCVGSWGTSQKCAKQPQDQDLTRLGNKPATELDMWVKQHNSRKRHWHWYKFHHFLYGRKFILVTDHKLLTAILSPKQGLPTLAAARLQRWALILAAYQYTIQFTHCARVRSQPLLFLQHDHDTTWAVRSTSKHWNADGFSQLPLTGERDEHMSAVSAHYLCQVDVLPVDADKLRRATRVVPILSKVA